MASIVLFGFLVTRVGLRALFFTAAVGGHAAERDAVIGRERLLHGAEPRGTSQTVG